MTPELTMHILFLTQILPYPLDTGAKVRAYYVLRHLTQRHQVTLVSFTRTDDRPEHVAHLRTFCQTVHTVPIVRSRLRDAKALATALPRGLPVLIARDAVPEMYALLHKLVASQAFDAVHADQTAMVQYALAAADASAAHGRRPLLVLDAHNALYQVVARLAHQERRPGWRQFLGWEAQRLARYEHDTYRRFDRVVFVTELDRTRLALPTAAVIPICADPAATPPVVRQPDARRVTFVGALHWPPNAQGIAWFARAGWPAVHAGAPDARLTIVGKNAPPEVSALAQELPGVEVLGYVEDLEPVLAETAVFLVPLLAGGGMRVKIVDAWTWGVPVVATSIGAEGLQYADGGNLLLGETAEELATATLRILREPELGEQLAAAGRRTAEEAYGWQAVYRAWERIYS
jgi:glycosyltransferase involved in cell wall biosynthesis